MKKKLFLLMVSWLAIGMSACTTFRPVHPPPLNTAKACAEWRWIGISLPEIRCPDIPGWTVKPLFPQLAPVRQKSEDYCQERGKGKTDYCDLKASEDVPDPGLIRELNRFCVYEISHPKKWWLSHHRAPPAAGSGLVRLDQDCAALSTSGKTDPLAQDWERHFKFLLTQAGVPEGSFQVTNPLGVRLAFLDTEPTRASIPEEQGNSPHGYALAHIARHIVCNEQDCAAQITSQLALPILTFNSKHPKHNQTDWERGGYLGMQSDLATAIRNEVDAWQQDRRRTGSKQRLILNLSLAWDGKIFGGLDETTVTELRAGTQAVYRALQYAVGFDVLVLAAAGNQKGEPCDNSEPLLPAAWERGSLREECCGKLRERPLLYAVGGVQSDDRPIINARRDAMPTRVAYGDRAVAACPSSGGHTAMLTGSSVATAIASAIAAVVWSSFPDLPSREVMDILDKSGKDLQIRTYFGFGSSSLLTTQPNVHRLSLCTALPEACRRMKSTSCPIQDSCPDRTLQSPAALVAFPKDWVPDFCQPWMTPQPDTPPCLSCGSPDG